ncbi:Asp-tRNA(Asn)/Glu-tRNA(Gln) amidotransferase subunit GatA [Bacillus sp. SD075]|uniref:amidase n=1 Tax=Bacillus sp. SD075 TaxID=2781732 RepID=UPI001A97B2E6|nr:amidase [Bacillus sp. SD075]MBO0999554.1 Asp-tRNA(Asn)/Glu-tRNA(Gln) amidotransferase subunit GatA [Bacillus sp. SD075]
MIKELFFKDIQTISGFLQRKEISPVELTKQLIERIEELEPTLNAYITVLKEEALKQAVSMEKEFAEGNIRSSLHGVPIAIKDIFEMKGSITTSGSKVFEHFIAERDAKVMAQLKAAGAIVIGKTNLHEFAMGATTENPHYGSTRNPWNIKKIPGGSSGGSAVGVATGTAFGAVGTDTGGSIRLPAALCGIVGLKPTYNLVNTDGCMPLSWTLDHIGPMTRTVADSRIMLRIMADPEMVSLIDLGTELTDLHGVRIGVCEKYFFESMDPEMKNVVQAALLQLMELGAEVVSIKLEDLEEAIEAQKMISKSEAYTLHEENFAKTPELYGKDIAYRLNLGRSVPATQYIRARNTRKRFIGHVLESMSQQGLDVLFTPTNAIPPFDIGSIQPEESLNNIFTLGRTPLGNLLGFPVISVPCGFTEEKMPVGFQLIGKPYDDGKIMNIAEVYEKSTNWVSCLEKNNAYKAENITL